MARLRRVVTSTALVSAVWSNNALQSNGTITLRGGPTSRIGSETTQNMLEASCRATGKRSNAIGRCSYGNIAKPSSRAQRSNPEAPHRRLDCFAAARRDARNRRWVSPPLSSGQKVSGRVPGRSPGRGPTRETASASHHGIRFEARTRAMSPLTKKCGIGPVRRIFATAEMPLPSSSQTSTIIRSGPHRAAVATASASVASMPQTSCPISASTSASSRPIRASSSTRRMWSALIGRPHVAHGRRSPAEGFSSEPCRRIVWDIVFRGGCAMMGSPRFGGKGGRLRSFQNPNTLIIAVAAAVGCSVGNYPDPHARLALRMSRFAHCGRAQGDQAALPTRSPAECGRCLSGCRSRTPWQVYADAGAVNNRRRVVIGRAIDHRRGAVIAAVIAMAVATPVFACR